MGKTETKEDWKIEGREDGHKGGQRDGEVQTGGGMIGAIEDDVWWHEATCESLFLSKEESETREEEGTREKVEVETMRKLEEQTSEEDGIIYLTEKKSNISLSYQVPTNINSCCCQCSVIFLVQVKLLKKCDNKSNWKPSNSSLKKVFVFLKHQIAGASLKAHCHLILLRIHSASPIETMTERNPHI